MLNKEWAIIISCEHANNFIPEAYSILFSPYKDQLNSHLGFDRGALELANFLYNNLADQFTCHIFCAQASRLLIDCNRSLQHRTCFSTITKLLPSTIKQNIIAQYYMPYRMAITQQIAAYLNTSRPVIHLSQHSFTPNLNGVVRNTDIGLLYNPHSRSEKELVHIWMKRLKLSPFKTRLNYPYTGTSDGLTTTMRKLFKNISYIGIEIEVNQAIIDNLQLWDRLKFSLLYSLV